MDLPGRIDLLPGRPDRLGLGSLASAEMRSRSRAQALASRDLVDLTPWCVQAGSVHSGFAGPVAVTRWVWDVLAQVPEGLEAVVTARMRAEDLLRSARGAALGLGPGELRSLRVFLPTRGGHGNRRAFVIACHADEVGRSMLTIGLEGDPFLAV